VRVSGGFAIPSTFGNCVCYQLTSLRIAIVTKGLLIAAYFDGTAISLPEVGGACSSGDDHSYNNDTIPLDTANGRAAAIAPSGVLIKPSNYHTLAFQVQANNATHAGFQWLTAAEGVYCDYPCSMPGGSAHWQIG
jgi:hypothetical protein